jgi:hypothetical protein
VAVQLLTRIPVRLSQVTDADLRRSCVFFLAVGLLVALAGIATRWAFAAPLGRPAATALAVGVTPAGAPGGGGLDSGRRRPRPLALVRRGGRGAVPR